VGSAGLNSKEMHLTPTEYELPCLLAQNAGKLLTHSFIAHLIWESA